MKEITLETKIADLLENYDGMKEILIAINPKFKKLNNPVLRRTVAKVAGIKQAAIVGGMDPIDLLNRIREAVGQPPVDAEGNGVAIETSEETPDWIANEPRSVIDADKLLEEEKNPLAETSKALKSLVSGETVRIDSSFRPEPLIEKFSNEGYTVFSHEVENDRHKTYIRKK
jgi:TusA-related sulfurtransferase